MEKRAPYMVNSGWLVGSFCALFLGLLICVNSALAVAVTVLAVGGAVAAHAARWPDLLLGGLLTVLLAGLIVPYSVSVLAHLGVLGAAAYLLLVVRTIPLARALAGACLLVMSCWLLLSLHPNVPSLSVGLLGMRKATFALSGLALGVLWPTTAPQRVAFGLWRLLLIAGIGVVVMSVMAPGVEAAFPRAAHSYTEQFAGAERVSGFYAGPFHVALLGSFLMVAGWYSVIAQRKAATLAAGSLLCGAMLLLAAEVRTGYVAVALAVLSGPLLTGWGPKVGRAVVTTLIALGVVAVLFVGGLVRSAAVESIPSLRTDTRVGDRVVTLGESIEMVTASPVIGWGAGAAGTTLDEQFQDRRHVTSHNQVLGWLAEGGLVGLACIGSVGLLLARQRRQFYDLSAPGTAAAVCLAIFGITGGVMEAMPISLLLLTIVGLQANPAARTLS